MSERPVKIPSIVLEEPPKLKLKEINAEVPESLLKKKVRYPEVLRICEKIGLDEDECSVFESALYTISTLPETYQNACADDLIAAMNRRGIVSNEDYDEVQKLVRDWLYKEEDERRERILKGIRRL